MDLAPEDEALRPTLHPLKIFDHARSQKRYVYACAPMVRYSKLAFRQTVHHYNTDLCWTPMILAKEFNRSTIARDSDFTIALPSLASPTGALSTSRQPPTIVQFGANVPAELARAASLVAPYASGVDLNCGCPQSWACAETLGAALMEERELVRDMLVTTRQRLHDDGWAVNLDSPESEAATKASPKGRSVSVKIRVHGDLRKTVDFIETVLGDHGGSSPGRRNVDWLTIHPRTRRTPSSTPISVEKLSLLTDMFGDRVPILVSGDVFTLRHLPYTSHLLAPEPTFTSRAELDRQAEEIDDEQDSKSATPQLRQPSPSLGSATPTTATAGVDLSDAAKKAAALPNIPKLRGLMAARALLANPALFSGHETCPWEAVDVFMSNLARAPLPLKLAVHHLTEMCGPGYGPDKRSLLTRKERSYLCELGNMVDVVDFLDEVRKEHGGIRRLDV
ncbi:uncharacterized protein B0I36DRAFT_357085 [Microdochium trichocladiopsis]|uniref:DUS-like FMN-binding domain-containing protein n=1 Tax=Microdochium trichocladiopsis TaxID=1682393 RepID=A0A9P9BT76_9PEZI|nr:uncharacterized protein B0I36DRAFT_357085 [Microdochium trichocladiopsis]KAH7039686.1 hypothetical protein B0I36DRAFT_357085 [Microdochium trichocladiopsis]